jgi:hypothetical protein
MKRFLSLVAAVLLPVTMFLAFAGAVRAQSDYSDYTWDTSTSTASDAAATGLVATLGVFYWIIMCCFGIYAIASLVIWIISLIHCVQNAPEDQKTMWILLIVLIPLYIGAWIYFFAKKKEFSPKTATPAAK